jgi:hypothetical protein
MSTHIVLYGETLLKIAAQKGNAAAAYDIALLNELSVSDELVPGTVLQLPVIEKQVRVFESGVQVKISSDVVILEHQTLADIAVQYLGDAERLMEVAVLNELSPTANVQAGSNLKVPTPSKEKKRLVQLFKNKANAPATKKKQAPGTVLLEGIGYWFVEVDFKVS